MSVNYGFRFGIGLTDSSGRPFPLDTSLFTINFYQRTFVKNGDIYQPVISSLGFKLWDESDMDITNKEYIARGLNAALYCPENKNYKISGNYLSNNFQYMSFSIVKWAGSGWQPSSVINASLKKIIVSVAIMSYYLDFNDYNTPIKTKFDDHSTFQILQSFSKELKLYLKLSEAVLDDDYFRIKSSSKTQFFEIESRLEDVQELPNDVVINFGIFLASTRDTYNRNVFSIFDLFGVVGGLFGLMSSIWSFIIGFIATQIMLSSVFKRLYFTNISNSEFEIFQHNKEKQEKLFDRENKEELKNNKNSAIDSKFEDDKSYADLLSKNIKGKKKIKREAHVDDENKLEDIKRTLLSRRKYQASYYHKILKFIPNCLWKYKGIQRK